MHINNINKDGDSGVQISLTAQFSNSKLPVPSPHSPLRCPAFSTHKYGRRKMMRFTDKKGIKIYCCVSFSPCKVWIKCHTLACELLNELVCSPWCGACKYPSWVWNGDCLVGGGGSQELGSVGHIWVLHRQLGRSKGLEYQIALLTGCVWLVFYTWSGR